MGQASEWAGSQNGPMVKLGQKSKWAPGSIWAESQNRPSVTMGYWCFTPERGKLTLNSKKETNHRVKIGQESKWAKGLKTLNSKKETNDSIKMGQEPR